MVVWDFFHQQYDQPTWKEPSVIVENSIFSGQIKIMFHQSGWVVWQSCYTPSLPNTLWGSVFEPPNTSFSKAFRGAFHTSSGGMTGGFWKTRVLSSLSCFQHLQHWGRVLEPTLRRIRTSCLPSHLVRRDDTKKSDRRHVLGRWAPRTCKWLGSPPIYKP